MKKILLLSMVTIVLNVRQVKSQTFKILYVSNAEFRNKKLFELGADKRLSDLGGTIVNELVTKNLITVWSGKDSSMFTAVIGPKLLMNDDDLIVNEYFVLGRKGSSILRVSKIKKINAVTFSFITGTKMKEYTTRPL